ncbi:hypothetical protein [Christiangramia aquimixticola]|uniref:hypothetical protein n=1 Tax=Christiangramia aquimixticola TaxID=1697558 RepID=UPI003AA8FA6A
MKNGRLQQFIMLALGMLIISCSKDEKPMLDNPLTENVAVVQLGPVLNDLYNQQTRQSLNDIPECMDDDPGFAQISLTYGEDDVVVDVIVEILEDENGFFTAYNEALEIPIPTGSKTVEITLNEFLVWTNVNDSPGVIIWAAPKIGSDFADIVENPLPYSWDLRAGSKTYTNIEMLCFDDRRVNLYGYQFFDITQVPIYNLCFFANYCSDSGRHFTANYSLDIYYGSNANGTLLYSGEMPVNGIDGEYYAEPICLGIPAPHDNEGDDEPYLYYVATLMDWDENYGEADGESTSGTLTWNEVQALLNDDGETSEYVHLFINCTDDISDCGVFEAIPESSFYETINPNDPIDYFEIITYLDEILFSFSQGDLCAGAADVQDCINVFNSLIADGGFVFGCPPAGCYTFIRQQMNGVNELITTDDQLKEFLGNIDSKGDALLWALANDYYWSPNNITDGAVKEGCSGYELVVRKIVSSCAPLQINRFHLRITPAGEIIVLDEEIIEYEEDLCI